jgi:hypothetical protein
VYAVYVSYCDGEHSLSLSLSLSLSAPTNEILPDLRYGFPFIGRVFSKEVLWLADCLPVGSCVIVVFTGGSGSSSISSL